MRYREFCSIIESKVEGIDVKDRTVSSFLRTAYEAIPKELTDNQKRKYAEVWVSGYQSGRLGSNIRSREILSGLTRKLVAKS